MDNLFCEQNKLVEQKKKVREKIVLFKCFLYLQAILCHVLRRKEKVFAQFLEQKYFNQITLIVSIIIYSFS